MNDKTLKFLEELTQASGVPGYEKEVRDILIEELKGLALVEQDNLGSVIFKKKGFSESPKVMIAAHMDEIGFMVKYITDDGFIRFIPLGGIVDNGLLSQRIKIITSKGEIPGVIGSRPPHILPLEERTKIVEKKNMFIDVGADSKKEVEEEFNIKPGDPIIPIGPFTKMKNGKFLMSKAWDDRIGCAVMTEVIKQLQKLKHNNTVYGAGTVQEEVGLRGAKTSVSVVNPDVAIILEDGVANDVPGCKNDLVVKLGSGPKMNIMDRTMIPNIKLKELISEIAKENKIPLQLAASEGGGTDGGMIHIHAKGVPCIYLGVAARYIHSFTSIIHSDDYENAVKLVVEVIKALDKPTVKSLTE